MLRPSGFATIQNSPPQQMISYQIGLHLRLSSGLTLLIGITFQQ
jgi:hypothetical protein